MDKELSRILDESIQLELNVADLYLSFCHAFAEDKDFWSHLAEEEGNHAALLRSGKLETRKAGDTESWSPWMRDIFRLKY